MELKENFIFQIDSELVRTCFSSNNHYYIEYNNDISSNKYLCVIYFSSNEIYYPNNERIFKRSIIDRNKYEWKKTKYPNAYKHIFIRDIQKQWYVEGVNNNINSPSKLLDFLRKETKGFKTYTIGSSAGGFAAIYYGCLLESERIYAFNPQFNIFYILNNCDINKNPLLFKHQNKLLDYYRLDTVLKDCKSNIFYFQSCKSKIDIIQYSLLEYKNKITKIEFKTSNHGFPFLRHNIIDIFLLTEEEIINMSKNKISPLLFSITQKGLVKTIHFTIKSIIFRLKKKMYDEKF